MGVYGGSTGGLVVILLPLTPVPLATQKKRIRGPGLGHISDVEARISQANGAFASLKILFKNKNISLEAKRAAYVTCVLSILLYGCECWANTAEIRRKLTSFHNRCARTMVGINMWHVKIRESKLKLFWKNGD